MGCVYVIVFKIFSKRLFRTQVIYLESLVIIDKFLCFLFLDYFSAGYLSNLFSVTSSSTTSLCLSDVNLLLSRRNAVNK